MSRQATSWLIPDDRRSRPTRGPTMRPRACIEKTMPHQATPVLAVGVLAHEDGRDRVVATDTEPKDESGHHQPDEARSHGGGDGTDDHDDGHAEVDRLPSEHVGDAAEEQRTEEGAEDGGARDPTGLEGAEVPLGGDDGGHRPDDEQVVGVGEEPDPRDHHRPPVELAPRGLVQQVAHRRWTAPVHAVGRARAARRHRLDTVAERCGQKVIPRQTLCEQIGNFPVLSAKTPRRG